jgi:signal peptidase I
MEDTNADLLINPPPEPKTNGSQIPASKRKKSVVRDWAESALIAFILAMIIRAFVIQAFKIPTGSMRPTLLEGDAILVNKFSYGLRIPFTSRRLPENLEPQRGDIIVFIYPSDPKKDFIKRVIALPEETVEIKSGTVFIDDKPLTGPLFAQKYYYNKGNLDEAGKKITVPKNSYFVLGDNSASSMDSRYWGFVPRKNVLGRAILIYWPPQRIRLIK